MKILFQGDSITDCGRNREQRFPNRDLGNGYVNLIASRLLYENSNFEIYNRGISGNRIGDMYARWIPDTLRMDYDVLSVLNGVNDVGFGLRCNTGADCDEYEFMYDRMIKSALDKNPDCRIVILEPFVFSVDLRKTESKAETPGDIYEDWDAWKQNIIERGKISKKIAQKYNGIFVPLFEDFCTLSEKFGAEHWSFDGIHPSCAGHEHIARKWIECCKNIITI